MRLHVYEHAVVRGIKRSKRGEGGGEQRKMGNKGGGEDEVKQR